MVYFAIIISLCITCTLGLYCPFTPFECKDPSIQDTFCEHAPKQCPGSINKDLCGCCNECAKVRDEECGGPFRAFGTCDTKLGLECVKSSKHRQAKGTCQCKKIPTPADCPYGLERTTAGCFTGKCKPLPLCEETQNQHKRSYKRSACIKEQTIFCDDYCGNCCEHYSTCPPNPFQRINDAKECDRTFLGDEQLE